MAAADNAEQDLDLDDMPSPAAEGGESSCNESVHGALDSGAEDDHDQRGDEVCQECEARLEQELKRYKSQLKHHMNHADAVRTLTCRFCPYRTFARREHLVIHVGHGCQRVCILHLCPGAVGEAQ